MWAEKEYFDLLKNSCRSADVTYLLNILDNQENEDI